MSPKAEDPKSDPKKAKAEGSEKDKKEEKEEKMEIDVDDLSEEDKQLKEELDLCVANGIHTIIMTSHGTEDRERAFKGLTQPSVGTDVSTGALSTYDATGALLDEILEDVEWEIVIGPPLRFAERHHNDRHHNDRYHNDDIITTTS